MRAFRPPSALNAGRRRLWWLAGSSLALAFLAWRWWLIVSIGHEWDAGAYWWADPLDPYARGEVNTSRAYLYAPAFVQVLWPLKLLPWEWFHVAWTTVNFGALIFILGPIGAAIAAILPPVSDELLIGNIHLLIAASIVIGFRHPGAWALPILTKVTPGVGVVWFAFRREWRALANALGVTLVIVAVSAAIDLDAWVAWTEVLKANAGSFVDVNLLPIPVAFKLVAALAIVAVAAVFDRRWLVPFAAFVALPVAWFPSLSVLLAAFPLIAADAGQRSAAAPASAPVG